MKAFFAYIRREPVMSMAVLQATIVLAVSFGAKLSAQQIAAVTGFASAVLGISGGIVRGAVQPISKMEPQQAAQVIEQQQAEDAKT